MHVINLAALTMIARLIAERDNPLPTSCILAAHEYAFAKSQGILQPVDLGDIGIPKSLGSGMLPGIRKLLLQLGSALQRHLVNTERLAS